MLRIIYRLPNLPGALSSEERGKSIACLSQRVSGRIDRAAARGAVRYRGVEWACVDVARVVIGVWSFGRATLTSTIYLERSRSVGDRLFGSESDYSLHEAGRIAADSNSHQRGTGVMLLANDNNDPNINERTYSATRQCMIACMDPPGSCMRHTVVVPA